MTLAVNIQHLSKTYAMDGEKVHALRDVSLEVPEGDFVAIMGSSGSGKSTMLNLLGCLDRPTSGRILLGSDDVTRLDDDSLSEIRASRIGFVFQSFGLLPLLSAYENVELPLRIARWDRAERHRRTERCIEQVGLGARAKHRPYELSGGEVQRLAIARALVHQPSLILADEPTGELDLATGQGIFKLLKDISSLENVGIVVATHDMAMASIADEVKNISDGSFSS